MGFAYQGFWLHVHLSTKLMCMLDVLHVRNQAHSCTQNDHADISSDISAPSVKALRHSKCKVATRRHLQGHRTRARMCTQIPKYSHGAEARDRRHLHTYTHALAQDWMREHCSRNSLMHCSTACRPGYKKLNRETGRGVRRRTGKRMML